MHFHRAVHAGVGEHSRHLRAGRLVEGHVSDQPAAEKRRNAILRAVHKLVGHQEFPRPQILLQRAHRAHGNNTLDSQLLHRANIRAKVDLTGQNPVPAPVPRQKRHALPFQRAHYDGIRRLPKRRPYANLARLRQPSHGVEPAAANDADRRRRTLAALLCPRCRHSCSPKTVSLISPHPVRCASKYRSPPKMDLSFFPTLLPPTASTAPPRLLPPGPAATSATPATQSTAA